MFWYRGGSCRRGFRHGRGMYYRRHKLWGFLPPLLFMFFFFPMMWGGGGMMFFMILGIAIFAFISSHRPMPYDDDYDDDFPPSGKSKRGDVKRKNEEYFTTNDGDTLIITDAPYGDDDPTLIV